MGMAIDKSGCDDLVFGIDLGLTSIGNLADFDYSVSANGDVRAVSDGPGTIDDCDVSYHSIARHVILPRLGFTQRGIAKCGLPHSLSTAVPRPNNIGCLESGKVNAHYSQGACLQCRSLA